MGWSVERLTRWQPPTHLRDQDVVVYGEPLFVEFVAQATERVVLEPAFDWLVTLPLSHTKRKIIYTTLEKARFHQERAFIKPAEEKSFPAKVYESGADIPHNAGIPETSTVLISEPVEWCVEFRGFVLSGQIAALSPYIRGGALAQDEEGRWQATEEEYTQARAFLEQVLADETVKLPPAVVVDVGLLATGEWAVVEANGASASGLCACSPEDVLPVLQRCCVPKES